MTNEELADEIIARLNRLIENEAVRSALESLMLTRVSVAVSLMDHPTVVVRKPSATGHLPTLAFLGMLNGIVGVLPDGPHKDWGFVSAVYDDDTKRLSRFQRTKS